MRLIEKNGAMTLTQSAFLGRLVGLIFIAVGLHTFTLSQNSIVFSAIFTLAGILSVILSSASHIEINDQTHTVSITHKSIVKKSSENIPFDDIAKIVLRKETNRTSKGTTTAYPLYLIKKNGVEILLATEGGKGGIFMMDHSKNERENGTKIAAKIGVPFTA